MDVGKRRACLTRIYMFCSATTWILTVIYISTQHGHLSSTKYDTCVENRANMIIVLPIHTT